MTDKAIAYSQFLTDVTTAAGLLEHGKQSKALAKRIAEYAFESRHQAAQPDCRTCANYLIHPAFGVKCLVPIGDVCTNGDKYQEATKVVLWRTEP